MCSLCFKVMLFVFTILFVCVLMLKLQKLNEDIMAKSNIDSSLDEIQDSKANADPELRTVAKVDSNTP